MREMSTYTVKDKTYEIVDKKARETVNEILAILTGGGTGTKYYTVTANLTNVELSTRPLLIAEGDPYTASIIVPDGYDLTECVIKMGDTDIFAVAKEINIESVTDNITITITAEKTDTGEGDSGDSGEDATYTVTINKTNIDIVDNEATEVAHGSTYQNEMYAKDGYEITAFVVTMGGEDVSNNGTVQGDTATVTIYPVTGNIVITVIAEPVGTVTHHVQASVTNATITPDVKTVTHGDTYQATVSANTDCALAEVQVWVNDVFAPDCVTIDGNTATITISPVTGNIVIIANATPNT